MKHIAGKQDISSVIAGMGSGSCTGTCVAASWNAARLLEAGPCAKHELSSLQIHSLEMVVIPPIHSNLIWQKVVCMTELRASIGGVEEGEVNDAHSRETKWVRRRIPLHAAYTPLINIIPHFQMAPYSNLDLLRGVQRRLGAPLQSRVRTDWSCFLLCIPFHCLKMIHSKMSSCTRCYAGNNSEWSLFIFITQSLGFYVQIWYVWLFSSLN